MEPHKDMNGNILRLGDYVVKEGNEEVDFNYTGNNNQNDLIERTPFSGIVDEIYSSGSRELNLNNEVVQSSGGDKVSYISIRVLFPLRLRDYIVPVSESDNFNIKLRRVNSEEGHRRGWSRYGPAQASGEGRRISRTGASRGQSVVEHGGRKKRKRKVRKKRTKKKARIVRSKRKRKKKRRTKRRKN